MLYTIKNKAEKIDFPEKDKYDNVIPCAYDVFILYKKGKIGLCKVENKQVNMICECIYDLIDCLGDNLFLSNDDIICCYNLLTDKINEYTEVSIDNSYIYACDKEYQYIIHQELGEVIFKRKYNNYNKSYYVFCGNTKNGAVFYDCRFSTYFYPTNKGYTYYKYPLNHPLTINKENIINIIDGDNGIGVIDSFGNVIMENNYDEISLELKITAKNKNESIEKIIPLSNTFLKDSVSPIEKW